MKNVIARILCKLGVIVSVLSNDMPVPLLAFFTTKLDVLTAAVLGYMQIIINTLNPSFRLCH